MKLKSIELQGFKSFVDRTRLEFDKGITAILGPNGCGKSNVVDAVRWVLGEQSPKTLRGGKMDDVIFKGTTKRRPVGMAEVTLIFENEDRGLPIDFAEVAIKRKVTRDGGSDYFLNGSLCRLKDLRDLFFDSGVNNTSYSIIEESMIKQILNENNEELRHLLEQGSGITKYKARRKETQRKLDRTQADLLRLYDIVEEIGREVRSLKYQVGKARRHQKLFREIRSLDLVIAAKQHGDLERQGGEARERLEQFRTQAEAGVGELAELQAKIEAVRPEIEEREAERRQLEDALAAFEEELQETERQVLVLQHRSEEHERRNEDNAHAIDEAEIKKKGIEGQIARLSEHLTTIEEELVSSESMLSERAETLQVLEERLSTDRAALDDATRRNLEFIESDASQRSELRELQVKQENRSERMAILDEDRAGVLSAGREAEAELETLDAERRDRAGQRAALLQKLADTEREETDLESQAGQLQEEVSNLLGQREAVRSTLELLQRLQEDYEGYGQGPREILQRHGDEDRITGGLADLLQVQPEDTAAVEILLAQLLDAVVVDGGDTALQLVGELRNDGLGQASFLFPTTAAATGSIGEVGGGRSALDVVGGRGVEIPALRNLLARTLIFDDDQGAVDAAAAHAGPDVIYCVSRQGLLAGSDGTMRGGHKAGDDDANLLGRKEKLEELKARFERAGKALSAAQDKVAANKTQRESLRESLINGRSELSRLDEALNQLQVKQAQLEHTRQTAGQRAAEMAAERERLAAEVEQLSGQEQQLTDRLDISGKDRQDSTTRRDELRERVAEAELERDEARGLVEELRLTHQRRESQKRETETTIEHLRQNVAEQFARREQLAQEIEMGKASIAALGEELEAKRELLGKSMTERERRRQVVRAAAEAIGAMHEETSAWHQRVQDIEKQRGGFRDQAHEMETLLATLDIKSNNLEERIEQQYKGNFQELIGGLNEDDLPKELQRDEGVFQLDQATELLETKRNKIGSLGPINHLALEEYETKSERLEFLENQRDDVEKARDDLVKAIAEINRTARKRFVETFEEVRRNYIAVFQTLFKGGKADLQLIRTDDPLESNLHITAQPTGKVINTVSLLSGGERCLTALSLLFAVYLVKPSPFCMLDEADAPLDDVNIGRFVNMLREFSRSTQFLVITHNKLTMETANHLYGVTMMEPGCSSIVSVSFNDVAETQSDQDLGNAIASKRREVDERAGRAANSAQSADGQTDLEFGDAGNDSDHSDEAATPTEDSDDPTTDVTMEASE